jgi:hypothetical protein
MRNFFCCNRLNYPHYHDKLIPVHARFSTTRQFILRLTDRSIEANSQDIMAVGFDIPRPGETGNEGRQHATAKQTPDTSGFCRSPVKST